MGFQAGTSLTGRGSLLSHRLAYPFPFSPTSFHISFFAFRLQRGSGTASDICMTPTVSTLFLVIFTDTHVMSKLDYVPSHAGNVKAYDPRCDLHDWVFRETVGTVVLSRDPTLLRGGEGGPFT